jgi:hypothetical protein
MRINPNPIYCLHCGSRHVILTESAVLRIVHDPSEIDGEPEFLPAEFVGVTLECRACGHTHRMRGIRQVADLPLEKLAAVS